MPDFTRPEYASYRELMGDLLLEHRWEEGDWYVPPDTSTGVFASRVSRHLVGYWAKHGAPKLLTWLPQLSDWLDMLEAAGFDSVMVQVWPATAKRTRTCTAMSAGSNRQTIAPSREEAAARLAMAVEAVVQRTAPRE